MKIILLRFSSQEDSTSGALFKANDDGTKDFLCYTIEDEYRLKKVRGETRIKGNTTYKVLLREAGSMTARYRTRYEAKYGKAWFKGMLWLQDTVGYSGEPFTYVYFHAGNSDDSSLGCIITGDSQENNVLKKDGWVSNSRQSFERIYPVLRDAVLSEGLELEIIDWDYPAQEANADIKKIVDEEVRKELSNKSPQNMVGANDIYEKISEINGKLKILEAKLEGNNIVQLWGSPIKITCPKCKTELLYVVATTKWICGNKKCIDYNRRQFGGTVEEEQETMKNNKEYWKFILSKAFRTGLQSAISLYLANTSGIIDANAIELIGVAFLSSFLSVIQNGLEQKNPKYSYEG